MINIRDIAMEIQNILGDQYRVYAINNAGDFEDIKVGESVEAQMIYHNSKIPVVMQTTPGTIVALRDLFSTSFGFSLEFYIDAIQNIDDDLKHLIQALNGELNTVGDNKFLMTFGTPFPTGQVMVQNGKFKQRIIITGNCAITDKSVFGNEIEVSIDGRDLNKSIISGGGGLLLNMLPAESTEGTLTPILEYNNVQTEFSATLHARIDDPFFQTMIDCYLNSDLLIDKYFKLNLTMFGKSSTWNTKLTTLNFDYSIGGYVIFTVGFGKTQVM